MNLIFLVSFILVLFIIVEISAIALKLTGMDLHIARFQALSALVTVGYTTSESEQVVKHHVRRRLIMVLMILGYLGTATIVSALIGLMRHPLTLIQASIAIMIVLLAVSIASSGSIRGRLDRGIERQLARHLTLQKKTVEEVLHLDREYGVAEVRLKDHNPLVGKCIAESKIRDQELFILAIDRKGDFLHSPRGKQVLRGGDKLIIYGRLKNIYRLICWDGNQDE